MLKLNKPKIIYVTLTVLLIASVAFYMLKEKEKKLRIYTQKQLTQTIEEKKSVENELAGTIKAKEAVEVELDSEKEISLALKKELEEREQEIKTTLDRLEQEISARKKAETQLMIVLKEKGFLEAKRSNLAQKSSKIIKLEKIVIKPGPAITGNIIMVNNEYAFVVVNLDSQDNIKVGDILSVYRKGEFIGKVQIERVEERMSAAVILADWQNAEFKENDDVVKTI